MAPPRAGGPRRANQSSEHVYALGVRGRKTGVTLRDTGVRDEHGMEPLDDIFSSPSKSRDGDAFQNDDSSESQEEADDDDDDGDNGEADMDLTTASGPDPAALLNGQRSAGRFGARQQTTRSPAKALFGSPAVRGSGSRAPAAMRQNPLLRPPSSPDTNALHDNSSPSKPVKRRLDFGRVPAANAQRKPVLAPANGTNRLRPQSLGGQDDDDDDDDDDDGGDDNEPLGGGNSDDSMQIVGGEPDAFDDPPFTDILGDNEQGGEEEDDEPEPPVRSSTGKRRGRPPKVKTTPSRPLPPGPLQNSTTPKGMKRGRPAQSSRNGDQQQPEDNDSVQQEQAAKRQKVVEAAPRPRGRPRGRPPANKPRVEEQVDQDGPSDSAAQPRKAGWKRKSSGIGAATAAAAAVPRGPPLPKSRGLVVRRREMSENGDDAVTRTRSGRTSVRPLAFWRNEHVEFDSTDMQDDRQGRRHFLLPTIKDIVRVDDEFLPPLSTRMGAYSAKGGSSRRGAGAKRGRKRRQHEGGGDDDNDIEEDDDGPVRDAWETDPGTVTGDIAVWHPEHEFDPPPMEEPMEMMSAEIALSSSAIQSHEVRGSTFRFVKTLSLPFFGTGMVDMPPGAEKKLKNSRKMHMTFFVHYGQVVVKVNDTEFRIAKGGMWSVPRGNYYSINNDTDFPARVFFAQGCEILTSVDLGDEEQE